VTNLNELPTLKTTENLVVKTSSGKELEADLVIPCFGLTVSTEAYQSSLGRRRNKFMKFFYHQVSVFHCDLMFNCRGLILLTLDSGYFYVLDYM